MLLHLFFFNDTATTEIYTLSLHDALPISEPSRADARLQGGLRRRELRLFLRPRAAFARTRHGRRHDPWRGSRPCRVHGGRDRKSTRLNSSHANISYAVFCLKKKKKQTNTI